MEKWWRSLLTLSPVSYWLICSQWTVKKYIFSPFLPFTFLNIIVVANGVQWDFDSLEAKLKYKTRNEKRYSADLQLANTCVRSMFRQNWLNPAKKVRKVCMIFASKWNCASKRKNVAFCWLFLWLWTNFTLFHLVSLKTTLLKVCFNSYLSFWLLKLNFVGHPIVA